MSADGKSFMSVPKRLMRSTSKRASESLLTVGFFVAFVIGGNMLSNQLQPWRDAGAMHCLQRAARSAGYRNACTYPVNLGYAVFGEPWPAPQSFEFTPLNSGETETPGLTIAGGVGNNMQLWMFACRAPHVPGIRSSLSNRSVTQTGCRRNTHTHPRGSDSVRP